MLHKENPDYNRGQFGFYSLDDLVPQDHLLRQIEEAINTAGFLTVCENFFTKI
ncbi:hypothetical protein [Streptococcus sp. FT1-106]|uniref:hypothetical protein n=1 Tax=Streptococcus sp. FT1-106 TaxID=3409994 RepID=UPI003BF4D838